MNNYKLLRHSDLSPFNTLVNEHLSDGYILYGEPFVSNNYIYQAVIKPILN